MAEEQNVGLLLFHLSEQPFIAPLDGIPVPVGYKNPFSADLDQFFRGTPFIIKSLLPLIYSKETSGNIPDSFSASLK